MCAKDIACIGVRGTGQRLSAKCQSTGTTKKKKRNRENKRSSGRRSSRVCLDEASATTWLCSLNRNVQSSTPAVAGKLWRKGKIMSLSLILIWWLSGSSISLRNGVQPTFIVSHHGAAIAVSCILGYTIHSLMFRKYRYWYTSCEKYRDTDTRYPKSI